jgi:hypothetical protein
MEPNIYFRMIRNVLARAVCPALLFLVAGISMSAEENKNASSVSKTTTNDSYAPFLINNILTYFGNNGDGAYNGMQYGPIFEWPKGSSSDCLFEEGFTWGGYDQDTI